MLLNQKKHSNDFLNTKRSDFGIRTIVFQANRQDILNSYVYSWISYYHYKMRIFREH